MMYPGVDADFMEQVNKVTQDSLMVFTEIAKTEI